MSTELQPQPELDLARLKQVLGNLHQEPGDECLACKRKIPKQKSDDATSPTRSVVSIHEPNGLEGTLDDLMIQVVDKYRDAWPLDAEAKDSTVGLEVVGGRSWKFYVVHFALYAVLMVPGLEPVEE